MAINKDPPYLPNNVNTQLHNEGLYHKEEQEKKNIHTQNKKNNAMRASKNSISRVLLLQFPIKQDTKNHWNPLCPPLLTKGLSKGGLNILHGTVIVPLDTHITLHYSNSLDGVGDDR